MANFSHKKILPIVLLLLINCAVTNRDDDIMIKDNTVEIETTNETQPVQQIEFTEKGKASFMADEMNGKETASGELFDMRALTAAHKYLPFGAIVSVTNLANTKTVQVRINDRGPFVKNRIIDVSFEAAKQLAFINEGITEVELRVIELGK